MTSRFNYFEVSTYYKEEESAKDIFQLIRIDPRNDFNARRVVFNLFKPQTSVLTMEEMDAILDYIGSFHKDGFEVIWDVTAVEDEDMRVVMFQIL